MAEKALRVLAFASGTEQGKLTFLGLMGLIDPPRNGVKESIRSCNKTGIHVVMITGDGRETALAIGNYSSCFNF